MQRREHDSLDRQAEQRSEPERASGSQQTLSRDPVREVLALQGSVGNRAVTDLLRSSGHSLDSSTRARMESRFNADFGSVRLHTGPEASQSAQALNATAYTIGEDIVLQSDQSVPDSLLAHELAHVVQQRHAPTTPSVSQPGDAAERAANDAALFGGSGILSVAGSVPLIQRQTPAEADDLRRRAELDQLRASMTEALYSSPQYTNTWILIHQAQTLNRYFEESFSEELPRTRVAAARALIGHYGELKAREQTAERDEADNALLYSDISGLRPWAPNRPTRVEDIPIFDESNVFDWFVYGGPGTDAEGEARGGQRTRRQPRPTPAPPQADGSPLTITDEEIEQARSATVIGSGLETQELSSSEQAAGQAMGGAAEVQSGLATLRQANVGQAYSAIAQRLNEADDASHEAHIVQENGERSLLDATGVIWYVTNRLFALDRTGHIVPGDFSFYLRAGSLPAGVYFFSPFHFQTSNGNRFTNTVMLRISGGVEVTWGDLFPRSMLSDFIPMIEQGRQAFARNAGIALIISSSFGERRTFGDLDPGKMWDAMTRSRQHMAWAVRSHLAQIIDNPGQEVFSQVFSLAIAQLGKMIPPVRLAMTGYQALRLAEWLGTTAGIAAYGNEDEVDIAAQSVARKIVEFTIGQLISKGISLGGRAGRAAVRSARRRETQTEAEAPRQLPADTTRREAPATQQRDTDAPSTGSQARPETTTRPATPTQQQPGTGTRQTVRDATGEGGQASRSPVTRRDGRMYRGDREVFVDQHGVVRYRDGDNRICFACNPQYYELRNGRWRRREGVDVPGTRTRRRVDRPTMPDARTAPRLAESRLRNWQEPLRGEAAAEQRRIMELARTNPQEAGRRYEDLVARDFQGGPEVQNRFSREGRRMDIGNRHEVTIEGRNGPFGTHKLDQFWLDLRDNRAILLTMPRISDAARTQLSILGAQAEQTFGQNVLILVRLTE